MYCNFPIESELVGIKETQITENPRGSKDAHVIATFALILSISTAVIT